MLGRNFLQHRREYETNISRKKEIIKDGTFLCTFREWKNNYRPRRNAYAHGNFWKKKEIESIIYLCVFVFYMKGLKEIRCPECNSKQIYTISNERVCRRCGNRWKNEK